MNPNLRPGYTTGACAAAAAKGALLALIRLQPLDRAEIRLPAGPCVTFALHSCAFTDHEGQASVIKDAGDDPDVTDKAEICARVTWSDQPGVTFLRGQGIGLVTKKGLPVPVGEPAINPVPRMMIAETLQEVLRSANMENRGLAVEISVPNGEDLAKKTFNPRLGIVGGISILGTTGIVVPYSTEARLASVTQEIDVALAHDCRELVLTVGERSERFARQWFALPAEAFVQIGPFFGGALRHGVKAGIRKAVIAVMIGKLAKFAAGFESVHHTASRQDFQFLAEIAQAAGADAALLEQVRRANTAQEVSQMMAERGLGRFYELICEKAWRFGQTLVQGAFALEVCLLGQDGVVLGRWRDGATEVAKMERG